MRGRLRRWLWPLFLLGGCLGVDVPVPGADAGDGPEGGGSVDTDGDGLCDATERAHGTDPTRRDTDSDGIGDYAEIDLVYDAVSASSPGPDRIADLAEVPGSTAMLTLELEVQGAGGDYSVFLSPVLSSSAAELQLDTLSPQHAPVGAIPSANVVAIEDNGVLFRGVVGRTTLVTEVTLTYPDAPVRGCSRVAPFRASVKEADGGVVAQAVWFVVLLPEGLGRTTAEICPSDRFCL